MGEIPQASYQKYSSIVTWRQYACEQRNFTQLGVLTPVSTHNYVLIAHLNSEYDEIALKKAIARCPIRAVPAYFSPMPSTYDGYNWGNEPIGFIYYVDLLTSKNPNTPVSYSIGFGPALWRKWDPKPPKYLFDYKERSNAKGSVFPVTGGDIMVQIMCSKESLANDAAEYFKKCFQPFTAKFEETYMRDTGINFFGFHDGGSERNNSLNPVLPIGELIEGVDYGRLASVAIGQEDPDHTYGSFALIQSWEHTHLADFLSMSQHEQEVAMDMAKKPPVWGPGYRKNDKNQDSGHVFRRFSNDIPILFQQMYRKGSNWVRDNKKGQLFVAYTRTTVYLEAALDSMIGKDGPADALLQYTKPVTGQYFYVPSMKELTNLCIPDVFKLQSRSADLFCPSLDDLANTFTNILQEVFQEVSVKVVDCPNLMIAPFNLAAPGLGSNIHLVDIGGSDNFKNPSLNFKKFDFIKVATTIGRPYAFFAGSAGADSDFVGNNAELIVNLNLDTKLNKNKYAKVVTNDAGNPGCLLLDQNNTTFGLLGNVMASDGKQGKVLEVKVSRRKSWQGDLPGTLNTGLLAKYGSNQPVGIAGVFTINNTTIYSHIMPGFPTKTLVTQDDVNQNLTFFTFDAPATCTTTFITADNNNMNLTLTHSHFITDHNQGGHYHYDLNPETVQYFGYFAPATKIYRVEQPQPVKQE